MFAYYQIIQTSILPLDPIPGVVTLDDLTRALPNGLYSTFRTFNGRTRVLGLTAHLDRLYKPAPGLGIIPAATCSRLREALATLLGDYPAIEARVRITLTTEGQAPGSVYIALEPLKLLPAEVYENGVHLATTHVHRQNPHLKSTNFVSQSAAERRTKIKQDIFELLIVQNNHILEGVTSNFFYIRNGQLGTAKNGILLGVTRTSVIRVSIILQIPLIYKSLEISKLPEIGECFITSSSRGIVPVVKIDDLLIGEGIPGKFTRKLMQGYEDHLQEQLEFISNEK